MRRAAAARAGAREPFVTGLGRAFGGAVIFAFPLLMTMEMWTLGFAVGPWRLLLFLLLAMPALVALSHFSGFEKTFGWREDVLDAFVALGVGAVASMALLLIFGVVETGQSAAEVAGKIAIQTPPAAIGAMAARKTFGGMGGRKEDRPQSYRGELFLMALGGVYVAINVAPTEEMSLIAYRMTPWHGAMLVALSLLSLHAFVYALGFRGQHARERERGWALFLHFTLAGYAAAVLVSLYVLWTFGALDGAGVREIAAVVIVLGFPATLGAATSRLVL